VTRRSHATWLSRSVRGVAKAVGFAFAFAFALTACAAVLWLAGIAYAVLIKHEPMQPSDWAEFGILLVVLFIFIAVIGLVVVLISAIGGLRPLRQRRERRQERRHARHQLAFIGVDEFELTAIDHGSTRWRRLRRRARISQRGMPVLAFTRYVCSSTRTGVYRLNL